MDSPYTKKFRDSKDNHLLLNKFSSFWIHQFIAINNILLLLQCGCLTCSSKNENKIEITTTYHLGVLQWGFQLDTFDENLIKNLKEIHFTINIDNGCILGFYEDTSVKCANIVSRKIP